MIAGALSVKFLLIFLCGKLILIWVICSGYSGTRIKTRKRNIAAPLDPAAFSDAVVQIYLDNAGDLVIFLSAFAVSCV